MKKRLDQLIVDRGLAESKTKAQALIMAGQVTVDGHISDKPGKTIPEDAEIYIHEIFPYVSRGALKLEKAFTEFGIDFENKTICDIGSSTGGFTDFALQHGAAKVFAVDVGTGQLAQKIREDDRVMVMERTDFRDVAYRYNKKLSSPTSQIEYNSVDRGSLLANGARDSRLRENDTKGQLDDSKYITEPIDVFVCDVSFISLKKIIPKIYSLLSSLGGAKDPGILHSVQNDVERDVDIILLIKPQFEAGAKEVTKGKGIIRDENLRAQIVDDIRSFAEGEGFKVAGLTESPITGAKGNVEFLLYLKV